MPGRFIVFEGIDGCGKTTVSKLVARQLGDTAIWTREPGATPLGKLLRDVLLNTDVEIDPRAEAMLMLADRAQHVQQMIRPALQRGQWVVCDRYTYSTIAYQGYGRGLNPDQLRHMSDWAAHELVPDLVLWLEVDPEVAKQRRAQSGKPDRIEQAGLDFQVLAHRGFRLMADQHHDRWVIVDSNRAIEQVVTQSLLEIKSRLGWP
jgi:dTMP kinase